MPATDTLGLPSTLLAIAVLLLAARLSSMVERFGQPAVLGELLIGVVLGNLGLAHLHALEAWQGNAILLFLSQLGVVILLFQIGLESNIGSILKVGLPSLLVAIVGVVVPFALVTLLVGPLLLPGLDSKTYLFLGAALTATSVGITGRVFKDLGRIKSREAQIVLGAAVIDDVLGLIILAIVSAMVSAGSISIVGISWITAKAILFLIGTIVIGQLLAVRLGKVLSGIHTGVGMKFTLAICFCLVCAGIAQWMGLAPVVGAFAAGLVLDPVHFKHFAAPKIIQQMKEERENGELAFGSPMERLFERHADGHVADLMEPLGLFFVPLFFVMTGMQVQLATMFHPQILLVAFGIAAAAFAGKIVAGVAAGPKARKWVVGWGMVPRGEVGFIFASIGKSLGVISDTVFSVIILVIIFTTLCTPPVLAWLLKTAKSSVPKTEESFLPTTADSRPPSLQAT